MDEMDQIELIETTVKVAQEQEDIVFGFGCGTLLVVADGSIPSKRMNVRIYKFVRELEIKK